MSQIPAWVIPRALRIRAAEIEDQAGRPDPPAPPDVMRWLSGELREVADLCGSVDSDRVRAAGLLPAWVAPAERRVSTGSADGPGDVPAG